MAQFDIQIRSFQDVLDFVDLATVQPFTVRLSNGWQSANGTSFMALVSMDHCSPLQVSAECSEAEMEGFRRQAERFIIE